MQQSRLLFLNYFLNNKNSSNVPTSQEYRMTTDLCKIYLNFMLVSIAMKV